MKSLLLQDKYIITGNDRGEVKIIDKFKFVELNQIRCAEAPVLKVEQQMYALLAQYKDAMGTIFIIKLWTTASGKVELKVMSKVETLSRTFTTFVSLILPANGAEFVEDHIALVTADSERPNFPKVWVLNLLADQVESESVLTDILPNQSDAKMDQEVGRKY